MLGGIEWRELNLLTEQKANYNGQSVSLLQSNESASADPSCLGMTCWRLHSMQSDRRCRSNGIKWIVHQQIPHLEGWHARVFILYNQIVGASVDPSCLGMTSEVSIISDQFAVQQQISNPSNRAGEDAGNMTKVIFSMLPYHSPTFSYFLILNS